MDEELIARSQANSVLCTINDILHYAIMGSVQDGPGLVVATPEELKAGAYDTGNIQAALEALHQDGFAVLKGVVDVAHVEHLNEYMSKEADELVKNNSKPFNQGVNCTLLNKVPSSTNFAQVNF